MKIRRGFKKIVLNGSDGWVGGYNQNIYWN